MTQVILRVSFIVMIQDPKLVKGRINTINLDTIKPIEDAINAYDDDKLSKYSGIAMHVLCEIITSKLLKILYLRL